jgi:hypothetical protein
VHLKLPTNENIQDKRRKIKTIGFIKKLGILSIKSYKTTQKGMRS